MAIDEIQARLARLEVERDAAIERRDYWQGEATKIRNHPGCGATRLTVQERAALRAYIGQLGYRGAVRELGVARGTLTTAVLGGAMRNSTAFLLRARVLAAQSTPPEPHPTSATPP